MSKELVVYRGPGSLNYQHLMKLGNEGTTIVSCSENIGHFRSLFLKQGIKLDEAIK